MTDTPVSRALLHAVPLAAAFVLAAVLLAACPAFDSEGSPDDINEPPQGGDGALGECAVDLDCVPAGPTCCECPTYAIPASSDAVDVCDDASTCELPSDCAVADAVCSSGQCVLQCAEISCDLTCDAGFRADDFGCLTCECEQPLTDAPVCAIDSDCVQVPADCCGCARGGSDTAVPSADAETFLGGLDCGSQSACPDVDVCSTDSLPRCVNGTCQLSAGTGFDGEDADGGAQSPQPEYCGTPQYPPCAAGYECVLNDPDANDANMAGVGVCRAL